MDHQPHPQPSSFRLFTVWVGGTVVVLLLLLALTNYYLNPLTFRTAAHKELADVLNSGKNFALDDANFDFRSFRREHIQSMPGKPEVILFAGSRFEVATEKTFPGRTFYNAFVHNDYFEDLLAITTILEEADKLPKTLVLSVRHLTFRPISERETDEWRMFSNEYQRGAENLGIALASASERFPFNHYWSIFSTEYLKHGIEMATQDTSLPYGPTSLLNSDDRDILNKDGSLAFSKKHIGSFSTDSARAEALSKAKKYGGRKATLPTEEDAQSLGKLLQHLKSRGVQTVIAVTPHHPAFWKGIETENYGRTLTELEASVKAIALKNDTIFVGSFDPDKAGCHEKSFRDYIHMDEACLKAIFDQIPKPPVAS